MRSSDSNSASSINSVEHFEPASITYSGANNEYIHLGKHMYLKSELRRAFGGNLNPGIGPYPVNTFGNPVPLGLASFAMTLFVFSLFNARAMGITVPNAVVGLACFYGGAIQFLAGVWAMAMGNTFASTVMGSYGSFWMSYAAIFIGDFGIQGAYKDTPEQLENAIGFFYLGWALVTLMFVCTTTKSTVMFFGLFLFLFITFILLAAGTLVGIENVSRAGGVFGVIAAFMCWYNAFAGVATKSNSYFRAYPIPLPGSDAEQLAIINEPKQ